MQSQEHSSIAGNTLNPSQTLQIEQQQDQQIPTSIVNDEEVKLEAKSKRQRKPKVKDATTDLPSDKGSEEKVRKQRQSKKNKETQDGAQVPAHQPPTDVKDESSKKAEKKRKQKEETKSLKKEAQPKIESLFKSQPKLNVQAAASSESDKKPVASIPANVGVDVPMEDIQQAGSVSLEQLNGKKPKREKKTTPQKMEQMLVLPEKVSPLWSVTCVGARVEGQKGSVLLHIERCNKSGPPRAAKTFKSPSQPTKSGPRPVCLV